MQKRGSGVGTEKSQGSGKRIKWWCCNYGGLFKQVFGRGKRK